jgi:hypothetical protein
MVDTAWNGLESEVARWRELERPVEFWLRDDDAVRPTAALERLVVLVGNAGVSLALAVIPANSEAALFAALPSSVDVLQHGTDHSNRSAAGDKKTEYPQHEASEATLQRLSDSRRRLERLGAGRMLSVLAPPWNRIPDQLVAELSACGFYGLSRYGARRRMQAAPGVTEINTHVDIIDWKGSRGFVGLEQALLQAVRHLAARREGRADATEPTGWLTHHLCHDEPAWSFLAELFERFGSRQGVIWKSARELFAPKSQSR